MNPTRSEMRWLPLTLAGCACAATLIGCLSDRHLVGEGGRGRRPPSDAGSGGAMVSPDAIGTPTGDGAVVGEVGTGGRGGVPTAGDASVDGATVVGLGDKASLGWAITISPEEVARRLSQLLLRKAPSAALTAAVVASAPKTNEDVGQLTDGFLLQENSLAGRHAFYRWWLNLDAMTTVVRDLALFPGLTDGARTALVEQTLAFVEDITWRPQGDLSTLLTEPAVFVNSTTAPWFPRVVVPAGTTVPVRVTLDASRHAGIVTQPAVVATADRATRANPSARGMDVRTRYLCQAIPPEPPDVMTPPVPAGLTLRQWLESIRSQPVCAACHMLIDPPGLAFGHFDAIGAFQETEGGLPIDTSGRVTAAWTGPEVSFEGAPGLASHLAQVPEVRKCYAANWLAFATAKFSDARLALSVTGAEGSLAADADYVVRRATIQGRLNLRGTIRAVTETHTFLDP